MQVHTRQTVYGSTSFSELPSAHVDYGGYIRTLLSVVFFVGIFFLWSAQSVFAEQREDIMENFVLTSGPITTDSGYTYGFTIDCSGQRENVRSGSHCRIDVRGDTQEYIVFESLFFADGSAYIRLADFANVDKFRLGGQSGALFSLIQRTFPMLKRQWLDLGDGSFLDKREQVHIKTFVLGELSSCMQEKVERCYFSESTQLMIRSILVGRTVTLLGSDEHMKKKLHALDSYLENGIPMTYDKETTLLHITNEITLSVLTKKVYKDSPAYRLPAHARPIGESLDRALSSLY